MKILATTCALLTATLLSACATQTFGTDFNTQAGNSLIPGVTTKNEVISRVGPLKDPQVTTLKKDAASKELDNPRVTEYSSYYFTDTSQVSAIPSVRASRSMYVSFIDSVLVHYVYSSTFAGESTDFDELKVAKISKGMSESDVVAILGRPSGRSVYPYTRDPKGTAISYYRVGLNNATRKIESKRFNVQFDASRTVIDFDLKITKE